MHRLISTVLALLAVACILPAQEESQSRVIPGLQPDQSILLPNGWTITPAGKQVPLSTLPMSMAISPDGGHLLVLNAGFLPPSISVVNVETLQETSRVPVDDAWLGLTFHPSGKKVYVGGGTKAVVYEFDFEEGVLKLARAFPVVSTENLRDTDLVGDVALSRDGRLLFAANLFHDTVTIMNSQTGFVVGEIATGRRPYRILPNDDGETLFISHWAEASVGFYRISDRQRIESISVGPHPTDLVLSKAKIEQPDDEPPLAARLFVASAHTNAVSVFGVTEGNRFNLLEQITISPTPTAPLGSLPTALALSNDGARLYMVASGNNTIVAADISAGRAEILGGIPTGWFPTAVAELPNGNIAYLNGKGNGSRPNPRGPDPTRRGERSDYVAAHETGSLGVVVPLNTELFQLTTSRVIANTPYSDNLLVDAGVPKGNPIPNRAGEPSPIRHVIYVVKENRSFDQIFGDFDGANGDPKLVVFDEQAAPNHRKLAREFVLLDNFYTNGSVSADGQNWSTGALANDYVEKLWPSYYSRRRKIYDFEGEEPAAVPPAGYLWTNALGAGLSIRNYGMWTGREGNDGVSFTDPRLVEQTDAEYAPFDLDVADSERVDAFLSDFKRLSDAGQLPRLLLIRLPGDHTAGREPGKRTARAMFAEHDYSLGRLVEGVSKSDAWNSTAIFIVEDDAQDGADHVNAHRAPALVVSPHARRGTIDSTFYSSTSVLRTIELILGLRPMTQFDAAATPLFRSFLAKSDDRPYEAVKPDIDLDERNPEGPGGRSRRVEAPPSTGRIATGSGL